MMLYISNKWNLKVETTDTVYLAYGWTSIENSTVFKDNKHNQANRQSDL